MSAIHERNRTPLLEKHGILEIVRWATDLGSIGEQVLGVDLGPRPEAMAHTHATGQSLVTNGMLGADVIRLEAGDGFAPHTHPGDHLLIVAGGLGTVTYDGRIYPTHAGEIFMIDGHVPHAVGAITDHVLLSIGCPHRRIDAVDRMSQVGYEAVTSDIRLLHCLICDVRAKFPARLHDKGCGHCPCAGCHLS